MTVTQRAYKPEDYEAVNRLLTETFTHGRFHNWPQQRWEYSHSHSFMDVENQCRWGIWEDGEQMVALVHYEWKLGDVHLEWHPDYPHLRGEMLDWAEANLRGLDGKDALRFYVNDFDRELETMLEARGYRREGWADPMSMMVIPDPFPAIRLPEGFSVQSLEDENDLVKVDRALWRGFDHEGEQHDLEANVASRKKMQEAPNFKKDLNIVVVAPDGWYVSYAGTWFDPVHKYAFVEPVATDPAYRMMGLGKAAVMEGVKRCALLGAKVAIVGSDQVFYKRMGFNVIMRRNAWMRNFE